MIKLENHLGVIDISHDYFVNLVGNAVVSCFGVAAMSTAGTTQGFMQKFKKKDLINKGIRVRVKGQKLVIDLHIIVTYGTNISAIVKSTIHCGRKNWFCSSKSKRICRWNEDRISINYVV